MITSDFNFKSFMDFHTFFKIHRTALDLAQLLSSKNRRTFISHSNSNYLTNATFRKPTSKMIFKPFDNSKALRIQLITIK